MLIYLKLYAVYNLLMGLMMIITPELWYQTTPGASATGPFNIHFVRDIGIAFFGAGLGLMVGVSQGKLANPGTAWIALVFLGGHGLLHVYEMAAMSMSLTEVARDFLLIALPAVIAVFCLWQITLRKQPE